MNQPNNEQYYWQLAEKILDGTITPEEQALFTEWYRQAPEEPVYIPGGYAANEKELKNRILTGINNRKRSPVARLYRFAAAASVFLLASAAGLYIAYHRPAPASVARVHAVTNTTVVTPGKDKAILTLPDGTQIDLDNAANGVVGSQGGSVFTKKDGHLSCKPGKTKDTALLLNTISTPKGGQYQVKLADGTLVWLNAASSLVFPSSFSGSERRVELKGEAYFEVAKNAAMPFRVKVNDLDIAVLGTHFNVKAYDDEAVVKTTLLEGAVRLNKQNRMVLLHPGQEARTDALAGIRVLDNVDLNQAVAWKNGLFEFNDPIDDIMRQVARWYNVDVVYEGRVTDRSFGGTIARKENIADVLKLLEMTGSIHFRIEGREIRVMP